MDRSVEAASPSWIQSRLVHWRAGVLTTAVVVCGLVLDLTVLGANPKVDVSTSSAAAPVVQVLGAVDSTVEVAAAVPTSVDLALPPVTDGAAAPETSVDTVPAPPAFAPAPAPVAAPAAPAIAQPATAQPAPTQPVATQPAAAQPAEPRAAAPSPSATTAAPTTAPRTTAAPTTAAPTTAAPTTAAPTTAAPTTAAPTTAAPTTTVATVVEYLSYTVNGGVGNVTLAREGNTISLYGFYPNAGWVYEVERNGPNTVKLNFFNVQTEQDREWKAQIEGGRIQVEN